MSTPAAQFRAKTTFMKTWRPKNAPSVSEDRFAFVICYVVRAVAVEPCSREFSSIKHNWIHYTQSLFAVCALNLCECWERFDL
eukprot:scaffold133569_cov23-Cyclotella_meneghiniana.AAC.1